MKAFTSRRCLLLGTFVIDGPMLYSCSKTRLNANEPNKPDRPTIFQQQQKPAFECKFYFFHFLTFLKCEYNSMKSFTYENQNNVNIIEYFFSSAKDLLKCYDIIVKIKYLCVGDFYQSFHREKNKYLNVFALTVSVFRMRFSKVVENHSHSKYVQNSRKSILGKRDVVSLKPHSPHL